MAEVILASLERPPNIQRSQSGYTLETQALVVGLEGEVDERVYQAITALGLPSFGASHPRVPGVFLFDMRAELFDTDKARVTLTYRPPAVDETKQTTGGIDPSIISIEINSSTVSERTQRDANGVLMFNTFVGVPELGGLSSLSYVTAKIAVDAEVFRPQLSISITQDRASMPKQLATDFIGTINGTNWSGYDPLTWLVTGIRSSIQNGLWRTTFEFSYRPETWRVTDVIQIWGGTPSNAVPGNGITTFDVYRATDWNQLGVSW